MLKGAVAALSRRKKSRTSGALKNRPQKSNACLRPVYTAPPAHS
jgi:hypothetical protein